MIDKDPSILQMLSRAGGCLVNHPYATWGGLSAFAMSLWASLKDGAGWLHSIGAGILAVLITLGVLAVMKKTGLHEEWMPLVGMLVGFIGADRIRAAVIGAWETHKTKLGAQDDHKQ